MNITMNKTTTSIKIEEIGINNIPDILAPGWNKKRIKSQDNEEFDQIFHLDNIPLSWFYKRMLSFHTIPPQFQTKGLIEKFLKGETIEFNDSLNRKRKILEKMFNWNERIKRFNSRGNLNTSYIKENILFLTYLDHINSGEEIFRLNNIIREIKKSEYKTPLFITVIPPSKRFYQSLKKQYSCKNNFYLLIDKENEKKAKNLAQILSRKWKVIPEEEKIGLFKNKELWNCLRYLFDFYFSYPLVYYTTLCYLTYKNVIIKNNIKHIVITSQHNLHERCLNAAGSIRNIQTTLIQHGAGMGSLNPELLPPFKIAVFSDYYKEFLIQKKINPRDIVVTGPVIFDDIYPFLNKKKEKNAPPKILVLTVPFIEQEYLEKKEYFSYIEKTLREFQSFSCHVTIKLHPREKNIKEYLKVKKENNFSNIEIIQKTGSSYLYSMMSEADVIINFSSTTALEAMILDKPLITILFDKFKNPFNTLLEKSKATREVHSTENVAKITQELLDRDNLSDARRAFIKKICGKIDGKASERVAKILF